MQLVAAGQVKAFIVNDLSRLYLNQASCNHLMEVYLPSLGIRLISILEDYDTATNRPAQEDMAMFLNIFNEFHPRTTSRKINSVIQAKAEAGVRIATIPPYGYQKNPENQFKIISTPVAAEVVQRVFAMCVSGMGTQQIANRLKAKRGAGPERIHIPGVQTGPLMEESGASL